MDKQMTITCEAYRRRLRDLTALGVFITITATTSALLTPRGSAQTARRDYAAPVERRAERPSPPGNTGNDANKSAARASVAADGFFRVA
jgi:hypothetical protein